MRAIFFILTICIGLLAQARAAENIALGRPVVYSPAPNHPATLAGNTDAYDLTDGKISTRADQKIWADPKAVGYAYPGLVQLALDLGYKAEIGEVAIRLQGGSESAGSSFPTCVELAASDDGMHFFRIAGCSRFTAGDWAKYGIPREAGKSWVHKLRFENVNIRARFIGIAFYGTAYCATDELYVLTGAPGGSYSTINTFPQTDFSILGPRLYFHKPVVPLPTDSNAPTPIGLIVPPNFKQPLTADIDLPAGVRFVAGKLGGQAVTETAGTPAGDGFTRYSFKVNRNTAKDWSRVYLRYDAPSGKAGSIRYRLRWRGYSMPLLAQPIRALGVGVAPQPRRIMAGLGWWSLPDTMAWPDSLRDFKNIGFNTLTVFGHQTHFNSTTETTALAGFRDAGFKILNIDSTFHVMIASAGARAKELYCQFPDGTTGDRLCPSYRGELYQKELQRLADECAKAKIDCLATDIELWDGSGPKDAQKCTRCQADFAATGATTWDDWKLAKGEQMWTDLAHAVRQRARQEGLKPPELGCYDFRPGINYHKFWPFDRLYPVYLGNSQVSTYSPLYPYNITFVGDEARQDRERLGKSNVMPWITPGDAGTFPGEMFTWALLECYANGSRGVHFWSGRVWDAETLDAHARALRIIAPVEDVIVDGDLVKGVACAPAMRVSGMNNRGEMFLLIAKDYEPFTGTVRVTLPEPTEGMVVDLDTGNLVTRIPAGQRSFELPFINQRARALYVRPTQMLHVR